MAGPGAHILGCAGTTLSADEAAFFRQARPWGFILFERNISDHAQVRALTAALRDAVGRDAPILIDQEGGRVQRMWAPLWREWLPPLDQVEQAGKNAARVMYLRSRIMADELREIGIDVNCLPLVDLAGPDTHPFLRNRCYGSTPDRVTEIGRAVATGLMAGGVLPVLKHIPGHGRGTVDSHHALPRTDASPEELTQTDFAPFRALADLPLGMTAHVVYSAYDEAAATISPRMIRLIRDEIGFGGLLMTDDISMQALGGSIGQRSAASIAAGCDLVLHCNADMAEMEEVVTASGHLPPDTVQRGDRALSLRRAPDPIDIAALEEELEALSQGSAS